MKRSIMMLGLALAAGGGALLAGAGLRPEASRAGAPAAADAFTVDPVHSSLLFRVKHMGVTPFWGRFNDVKGSFLIDPERPEASSVDITIPVASVDTHNKDRDNHLKQDVFFSAAEFPDMTFKSKSVSKSGDNAFNVAGDLTIRGTTKPVTVKVMYGGTGKGMKGGQVAGLEGTVSIKRSDFGVSFMVGPALSDEVEITVALEGNRK